MKKFPKCIRRIIRFLRFNTVKITIELEEDKIILLKKAAKKQKLLFDEYIEQILQDYVNEHQSLHIKCKQTLGWK